MKIRVGTRESKLAVAQSEIIIQQIRNSYPYIEFEIIPIKTKGDLILNERLDKTGGKGLFVKEIEQALIDNNIDIAIHSMKDMPGEITPGLKIAALSKREDPRDVLVSREGSYFSDLPRGTVIGTSSLRREIQLKAIRDDISFKLLRGNVNTRIDKMKKGEYDAIVLAAAGLKRLSMQNVITQYFEVSEIIPAAGQGILGVQTREDFDSTFIKNSVHCKEAELQLAAERAYMDELGGDCSAPVGAYAAVTGGMMILYGMYADIYKNRLYKDLLCGQKSEPERLGKMLANKILANAKK